MCTDFFNTIGETYLNLENDSKAILDSCTTLNSVKRCESNMKNLGNFRTVCIDLKATLTSWATFEQCSQICNNINI